MASALEPKPSRLALALPFLLSLAFGGFAALPQIRGDAVLLKTFLITAGLLLGWSVALAIVFVSQRRTPELAVSLLKQHYLQACAHTSILLYWGWYWRPVYEHAYLIAAQLVFAYAFDMLLQLSRHKKYTLGFGPFPIIFSINLFLWFKDDWFYDQLLIVAVGFAAKEFLRWNKGGKWVHIFNPSSFPLAIACWALLFTHQFDITWGEKIAGTQFFPPHIFPFIFLVSLPGQFLFGVTSMTLPAVLTMYAWGHLYFALTGTYYLYQDYITIAVFLAMHLLITDPSTSPRTELGRILYAVGYTATVIVIELILDHFVEPGFAAKLLLVPVLNVAVQLIDRAAQSRVLRPFDPARIAPRVTGRRRNLAYMTIWAAAFGVMLSLGGIGDRFPGQDLPFWFTACKEHPERGCTQLTLNADLACHEDSGWSCNYLAIRSIARAIFRPTRGPRAAVILQSMRARLSAWLRERGTGHARRRAPGRPPHSDRLSNSPVALQDVAATQARCNGCAGGLRCGVSPRLEGRLRPVARPAPELEKGAEEFMPEVSECPAHCSRNLLASSSRFRFCRVWGLRASLPCPRFAPTRSCWKRS